MQVHRLFLPTRTPSLVRVQCKVYSWHTCCCCSHLSMHGMQYTASSSLKQPTGACKLSATIAFSCCLHLQHEVRSDVNVPHLQTMYTFATNVFGPMEAPRYITELQYAALLWHQLATLIATLIASRSWCSHASAPLTPHGCHCTWHLAFLPSCSGHIRAGACLLADRSLQNERLHEAHLQKPS